ncbi:PAS domain-containing protein, partial [Acinetobacter baumannii]
RLLKSGYHSPEFYRDLWRHLRRGQVWQGEICNRRKDGGHYWVSATILPVLDPNGLPRGYVSVRTDITRLKESEDNL